MKKIFIVLSIAMMTLVCASTSFAMHGGGGGGGGGSSNYYPEVNNDGASNDYTQTRIDQASNFNSDEQNNGLENNNDNNENDLGSNDGDNGDQNNDDGSGSDTDGSLLLSYLDTADNVTDGDSTFGPNGPVDLPGTGDQQPIPEPATLVLIGSGLLGIAAARRKK